MAYETLLFEVRNHVGIITLNRPNAANAIDLTMSRELMQVTIACDEDPDVRALLITGNGPLFSAGGDIRSFAEAGDQLPALIKEMTTNLHAAISRMARMDAPVVGAITGAAAGAGMSLACACDFTLAGESSTFTMAYTGVGLTPDGSSTYVLPRLIGVRKTLDLMLTNRRLTAAEAAEMGLINEALADDEVLAQATKMAEKLAAGPTRAFGNTKRLLLGTFGESLETQMELETRSIAASGRSRDGRAGIAAFLEKRRPEFTGS